MLTAKIKRNGLIVATLTFNYRAGFFITSIDMLDNYYASGVLVAKTTMGAAPSVMADWTMPPGISIVDFPYLGDAFFLGRENCTVAISAVQGGYYNICATATNDEGCTTPQFCTTVYVAASRSFAVSTYPNPASDVLKLSIKMTDEVRRQQLEALAAGKSKAVKERTYTVQLFGTTGNLVQQEKATGDDIELSFDVSGLPNGSYFVVVKLEGSGEGPQRKTVIVRK